MTHTTPTTPTEQRTLASSWTHFRAVCVAADASPEEVFDVRNAFYAGAQTMANLLLERADADAPVEDLLRELEAFAAEMLDVAAGPGAEGNA